MRRARRRARAREVDASAPMVVADSSSAPVQPEGSAAPHQLDTAPEPVVAPSRLQPGGSFAAKVVVPKEEPASRTHSNGSPGCTQNGAGTLQVGDFFPVFLSCLRQNLK